MALSDPFEATMAGAKDSLGSVGQNIGGAITDIAKLQYQKKQESQQRQKSFDMLKQMGLISEETTPPSVDDLKDGLKKAGQTTGKDIHFNIAPDADEDQQRKFLTNLYKSFNIPVPQGKTKTTISQGVSMDLGGGISYTTPKPEKTVAQQVAEVNEAQKLLDSTPGMSGKSASESGKGVIIKDKTGSGYKLDDSGVNANVQAILEGRKSPIQIPAYRGEREATMAKVFAKNPDFDQSAADIAFSANKNSAGAMERQFNNVTTFESTALKNADLAEKYSDEVLRSDSPLLNQVQLHYQGKIQGDPKVAGFVSATKTFANEWAKVMTNNGSSGSVTDTARKESDDLISAAQNPEQFKEVLSVARKEMSNRKSSYYDQLDEIKDYQKKMANSDNDSKSVVKASGTGNSGDYQSYLKSIGQ